MPRSDDLRLANDIGGTFTDTVLMSRTKGVLATAKTLTTHNAPVDGALEGARQVLAASGVAMSDLGGMVHGTTLATNALIERRGAKVASVTTEGFRDILEIAYERRYAQYDINIEKPSHLASRDLCFTLPERMDVQGHVLHPLDMDALPDLAAKLLAKGVEAVAICFLHAYANPAHEVAARQALQALCPNLRISISSEVSPEAREFDRLSTTLANAYIQPLVDGYLTAFQARFSDAGLACPILMMTAGGGMTTLDIARQYPIRLVESGPAGGAVLAAKIARDLNLDQVLSFDIGGTTAKLCLIDKGQPQTARQFEIARAARFIKGSGLPVRIPVVEMIEIGAGGGSIAAVDRLGRLTVGPESAGSEPGPAAFGRGGLHPTVTDADLALGYLLPDLFADGAFSLDSAAAQAALARDVGDALKLDPVASADGISRIVDESMASAGRMHAVESGKDLGSRCMIAFGGNGPLHATRVARSAGITSIVVPPDPSVGSALGFLFAPVSFELTHSHYATLDDLPIADINQMFTGLIETAANVVSLGAPGAAQMVQKSAFMRYRGQGHEIEILLPETPLTCAALPALIEAFEAEYRHQFSRPVPGMTIEILNWAVRVQASVPAPETHAIAKSRPPKEPQSRKIRCDVTGRDVDAAVHFREDLSPGQMISGPALVVERQTTALVSVDFTAAIDRVGNLILSRTEGAT